MDLFSLVPNAKKCPSLSLGIVQTTGKKTVAYSVVSVRFHLVPVVRE